MRIEADRDICIGSGNCVWISATLFDQDDDGIVVVLADDVPADQQDKAAEAVRLCPSQALTITQD